MPANGPSSSIEPCRNRRSGAGGAVPLGVGVFVALIGGVGIGLYPDFSMAETMNHIVETIEPDPAAQPAYEKALSIFEAAYQALVPVYDIMAE